MRKLLFFLIVLFSYGCSAAPPYIQGDPTTFTEAKFAKVTPSSGPKDVGLMSSIGTDLLLITKIDGENTETFFYGTSHPQEAYLLPGEHELVITFIRSPYFADTCINLKAEAGKTYLIKYHPNQYSVQMWLVDEETGELEGSLCGFENYTEKIHNK